MLFVAQEEALGIYEEDRQTGSRARWRPSATQDGRTLRSLRFVRPLQDPF
jgi:hypothetical protein